MNVAHASRATGSVDSIMAGLACGEASPLAWRVLQPCIDTFMTINDADAVQAMRALAAGGLRDAPVVAGESGAAGYAALSVLMQDSSAATSAGLEEHSRVLVINTKGATAPALYRELTGHDHRDVLERQRRAALST
jgi:diaminopropionate ammonia-lyase